MNIWRLGEKRTNCENHNKASTFTSNLFVQAHFMSYRIAKRLTARGTFTSDKNPKEMFIRSPL